MKITSKRLVSLLICLAMVLAVLPFTIFAANTVTLYCAAPESWTACKLYAWNGSGNNGWPGISMTKGDDGIWYAEIDSSYTNVIFNNGAGTQSADLTMPTDNNVQFNYLAGSWGTYGTEVETPEIEYVTVYCDVAAWGAPNAYWWGSAVENSNSWPGNAMTLVEGTVYTYDVPSDATGLIFNDGSSQTDNLTVPTDDNVLWNGTGWTTYSTEVENPTYELVPGVTQSVSIPVGGFANVVVDATASDMVLNVNGHRNYFDWYIAAGRMPTYPGPGGFAETQLPAGNIYTIAIHNISEDTVQVVDVTASVPATGTMDNPTELVIGENSADVGAGGSGYFYTWTATEDGKLTIAIDTAVSSDWNYVVNVYGDIAIYGDMHRSDDATVVSSETVSVSAGDRVEVVLGTATYGAATVVLNASFVAGGEEGGDVEVPGSSQENAIDITFDPWCYIEAGATVWFVYDDSDDALFNGIYSQLLKISSSVDYSVKYRGQDVLVDDDGFVDFEMYSMDYTGMYYIVVTNNSEEKAFFSISVEDKPVYVDTYEYLYVGDNDITLDASAEYTLWEFAPDEAGTYIISIPDASGLIGDWGTSWYPQDKTENKSNTFEWTCTSVGQSIMIGVAGVDSTVLNIKLKEAYVPDEEIDWTVYENEQLVEDFVVEGDLIAIDVTDDIADIVWIDENGFFRYGSETGPIVVADISDCLVNFAEAYVNGQLRFNVYENGELIARIDVNDAIMEYVDAGVTPLTEELAYMLIMLGEKNGWYDQSIPGYYLWSDDSGEDSIVVNPDEAWLFPCYIVEGTEIDEPDVTLSDYIVAGSSGLCGSEWDPADANNKMVDNGDGTYTITYKNVAAGTYEFKITKGSWEENWGVDGFNGGNVSVTLESAGDITITFVAATGEIIVDDDQIPVTGDVAMDGVFFVAILAAMGVVALVCTKKKFF